MTIGFTCVGSGPEHVLAMHDWNGDHTNYDPILPYLDEDAFTYAFVDLRGYGKSKVMTGDYTVSEVAGDCLAVVDELGEFFVQLGGEGLIEATADADLPLVAGEFCVPHIHFEPPWGIFLTITSVLPLFLSKRNRTESMSLRMK